MCDWVLPIVIDGVDHAVTGGSLRHSRGDKSEVSALNAIDECISLDLSFPHCLARLWCLDKSNVCSLRQSSSENFYRGAFWWCDKPNKLIFLCLSSGRKRILQHFSADFQQQSVNYRLYSGIFSHAQIVTAPSLSRGLWFFPAKFCWNSFTREDLCWAASSQINCFQLVLECYTQPLILFSFDWS